MGEVQPTGDAAEISEPDGLLSSQAGSEGRIRLLTLNRPHKRNALDTATLQTLMLALRQADADETVRAVVLCGRGPAFCAGGDRAEFCGVEDPRAAMATRAQLLADMALLISALAVPVVTAVHGAALGAGAMLALAGDIIVAGEDLSLGYPEIQSGVVPAVVMGSAMHALGDRLAFELLTTPRRLDAPTALQHGLIACVVPPLEVEAAAIAVAESWVAADRAALRQTKHLFGRVRGLTLGQATQAGVELTASTWSPPPPAM